MATVELLDTGAMHVRPMTICAAWPDCFYLVGLGFVRVGISLLTDAHSNDRCYHSMETDGCDGKATSAGPLRECAAFGSGLKAVALTCVK